MENIEIEVLDSIIDCESQSQNLFDLKDIAKTMNKTVEDCKIAWKAIRDSRRYYLNTQKKKSGSSGGEILETPELNNNGPDWELSEELSYLPNISKKRTTLTSAHFGTNSESGSSNSNYTYTVKEKKNTNKSNDDFDYMKSTIGKIVDTCTTLSTIASTEHTETDELAPFLQIIKYKLQQLPAAEAENLCIKFMADINTALNNNK